MENVLLSLAYLVAAILFILSLRGLSSQETARRGNLYGIIGMVIAIGVTFGVDELGSRPLLLVALAVGAAIGAVLAVRVAMTAMPQLVAMLHSFVGAAAVIVGFATYLKHGSAPGMVHLVEVYIDIFIGALTFTGSVIAFLKLRGSLSGRPLILPARHALNAGVVLASIGLAIPYASASGTGGLMPLVIMTALSGLLGIHLVMAIGGADMPVVVSMLNSYSGWTAAAAGFMLSNDLLIITGALVGSSGAILSVIMCRAMNRSIWNVIFGGFGSKPTKKAAGGGGGGGTLDVNEFDVDTTARKLLEAKEVIIVPGYGMAVARAQHAVREITDFLRERGTNVRFAIHPVAGRLPGHMNVLLAEASVPYDIVLEMDEINPDFNKTQVSLVIGANDIVNPGAETDESSPIYGMPVLRPWNSDQVVICKRSRRAGYAGVDNPLFYKDNTAMLFGDAKDMMEKITTSLRTQADSVAPPKAA